MTSRPGPPLFPSRSETFPCRERVMMFGDIPVMYFDEGSGPAILFVHGMGGNMTHFEYLLPPLLAAGYRVCGLDLPGFGLSGKPHRDYSVSWLADAVLHLIDHLKIDRLTLCGHSLGGLVCSDIALREPKRVERLVLISSAGLTRLPRPLRMLGRVAGHPLILAPFLEMNAMWLLDLVLETRNEKAQRFIEQSVTRPDTRFTKDLARVVWSMMDDLTGRNLLEDAAQLTMPTLVIWGAGDRLLPLRPVPKFVERLASGGLEVIEECGHMPIIEQPEMVTERMLAFLQQASRRRAAAG